MIKKMLIKIKALNLKKILIKIKSVSLKKVLEFIVYTVITIITVIYPRIPIRLNNLEKKYAETTLIYADNIFTILLIILLIVLNVTIYNFMIDFLISVKIYFFNFKYIKKFDEKLIDNSTNNLLKYADTEYFWNWVNRKNEKKIEELIILLKHKNIKKFPDYSQIIYHYNLEQKKIEPINSRLLYKENEDWRFFWIQYKKCKIKNIKKYNPLIKEMGLDNNETFKKSREDYIRYNNQ